MHKIQKIVLLTLSIAGLQLLDTRVNTTDPLVSPQTTSNTHPLMISEMRSKTYPGSEITIEKELESGTNYFRYIASYYSEGLKQFALLTIPDDVKPETGWPVIIFNHGHIPPEHYQTAERYVEYTEAFSRNGYIVFRPDYRGHGNSEGIPRGAYYSPDYTIDVLNAVTSIQQYPDADPKRIGMWGHSMGGHITLRSMVVSDHIKAGVIWGGVVGSYQDLIRDWPAAYKWGPSEKEQQFDPPSYDTLAHEFGDFDANPEFWSSVSSLSFVHEISGPLQLHHATSDQDVPFLFSERLESALKDAGKEVELYAYEDDNHDISNHLSQALDRSVQFFDKHVKGVSQ